MHPPASFLFAISALSACDGPCEEPRVVFEDRDRDGWGAGPPMTLDACVRDARYVTRDGDCDDEDPRTHPTATESCGDGVVNDCGRGVEPRCLSGERPITTADWSRIGDATERRSAWSVALLPDRAREMVLAVGAPFTRDGQGLRDGAVYLHQGEVTTILQGDDGWTIGQFLASAGDVNGDGADDLVVGRENQPLILLAPFENGRAIDLATTVIDLPGPVVSAGDLDGDGLGDLIGGDQYRPDRFIGEAYLFRAPHGPNLGANNAHVTFSPESVSKIGQDVASAGDVDGDGLSDVVVGGPYYSEGRLYSQGVVYLLCDPPDGRIGAAEATARLYGGLDYEDAGTALDEVGDLDDDGYDDLVIGSASSFDYYGNGDPDRWICASVVYGPVEGDIDLADADARISAIYSSDCPTLHTGVAGLGDSDGDGYDDFVIGAQRAVTPDGIPSGVAYLFYGPVQGAISFADANAQFYDPQFGAGVGLALDGGDVNGDGYGDLLLGAYDHSPAGAAYLFLNGP